MRALPHVVRRGSIFHFRRVVPKDLRQPLKRTELVRSLETADVSAAKRRSRRLYLLSEWIFDAVRFKPMLSENDIAKIVQEFYSISLECENRTRLTGGAIAEETRQRRVRAYERIASDARKDLARNDFSGADLISFAVMDKYDLFGKLEATELAGLKQALQRANIEFAETLKARYEGDFNYEPRDKLLKAALTEQPLPPIPALPNQPPKPLLSEMTPRFLDDRSQSQYWRAQSGNQARKTYELFVAIIGDRPVDQYTRADAGDFKDLLQKLPAAYGKAAEYRGVTPSDIAAHRMMLPPDQRPPALSTRTVQRHFSAMSALWDWLKTRGLADENLFTGFKFPKAVAANQQRRMWLPEELNLLFQSPVWTGCKSRARRSHPGDLMVRDEKFWLPLIALFSGMRAEEICQLHLEDLRNEEGVWFFDINSRPPRHVKNHNAVRRVPIHADLLAFGLLDYAEALRERHQPRLFPNLKPGGADGRFGHAFTKWFSRYRKEIGLFQDKLDFHSFRHSAITLLQRAEVPEAVTKALVGHAGTGETARYTKGFTLPHLKRAIDQIKPEVDLGHLLIKNEEPDKATLENAPG